MSIEVKVPQLPESVADATLVSWHKSAGDRVSRDENLVDLETDKVVLEVPSPADGILKEIRIADGVTETDPSSSSANASSATSTRIDQPCGSDESSRVAP